MVGGCRIRRLVCRSDRVSRRWRRPGEWASLSRIAIWREWQLLREDDKGEVPLYVFRDVPRQLNEYEEMSTFHQTSPESGFTKRWICSKATRDGRITVANRRLIITAADRREETVLSTDDEVRRYLRDHFGIEFDDTADLSRLDSFPNG